MFKHQRNNKNKMAIDTDFKEFEFAQRKLNWVIWSYFRWNENELTV